VNKKGQTEQYSNIHAEFGEWHGPVARESTRKDARVTSRRLPDFGWFAVTFFVIDSFIARKNPDRA